MARSAPLSAADWRFLLPESGEEPLETMILLGGSDELARLLKTLRVARRITTTLPRDESADAVIVLEGHGELDLAAARSSLSTRGVLYLEISRWRQRSSPRKMHSLLMASGFHHPRLYALAPHPRAARVYVPLQSPEPLAWYVRSAYDPPSRTRHLVGDVMQWAGKSGGRLVTSLLPWYCATATATDQQGGSPAVLPSAVPGYDDLYPLMLADTGNRVVLLPFTHHGSEPEAVIKVPKVESVNDRTINEHAALSMLRARLPAELLPSIPRPVGLPNHRGLRIGVESYLRGRSLTRLTTSWWRRSEQKVDDLNAATRWLSRFHEATIVERVPWPKARTRCLESTIAEYQEHFGEDELERELFSLAGRSAGRLADVTLPTVWQHRDFNIWNVLDDGGTIRVLDWEGLQPGPALTDLLHFATHWHEAVAGTADEDERLRAFEDLWLSARTSRHSRAVYDAIQRYTVAMDVDRRLVPFMLLYTWLELAIRRSRQQRDQGVEVASPRQGNRNVAYIKLMARHRARLFEHFTFH
jgi:hypothetical protein